MKMKATLKNLFEKIMDATVGPEEAMITNE